jgi:hypothetical protein
MSSQRSIATCAAGARPRLGSGETTVIVVIIIMAVLMTTRGTPLLASAAVLGSAGLLASLVVRFAQTGPHGTAIRSAGRALLSPTQV